MYYYLYYCDLYLEEIDYTDQTINNIKFSKELRASINDFETAVDIRRIVFIELGVELRIGKGKLFEKFGKEDN